MAANTFGVAIQVAGMCAEVEGEALFVFDFSRTGRARERAACALGREKHFSSSILLTQIGREGLDQNAGTGDERLSTIHEPACELFETCCYIDGLCSNELQMTGGACCRAVQVLQGELSYDMKCARGRAFYIRVYSNYASLIQ